MVDLDSGTGVGKAAGKFHATMALAVVETVVALCKETGVGRVALSGGVFQNELLTNLVVNGIKSADLTPYVHRRVPCNDGGISLGQAVIATSNV
jgi:hydrogenase maturation protein HypF